MPLKEMTQVDNPLSDTTSGNGLDDSQVPRQFTAPDAVILVVEDNETNLAAIVGLLRPLAMQMDTAQNGAICLRMVQKKRYHLIFMDHLMPVMDGIEATQQLRRMGREGNPRVPIIALTADESVDARELLLRAGMDDFLKKPIDRWDIYEKIRRWLPAELLQDHTDTQGIERESPESVILPCIQGIDIQEGMIHAGTKVLLRRLLENFYRLIDRKADKIERCLAEGALREVTIEVHALKNTARMIGARDLSAEFERLERYGEEEDAATLAGEVPVVLRQYRSFQSQLEPFFSTENREKQAVSEKDLVSLWNELKEAMEGFRLDDADAVMERLENVQIPPQCQVQMEELRAYMAEVDIAGVVASIDLMIEMVSKEIERSV